MSIVLEGKWHGGEMGRRCLDGEKEGGDILMGERKGVLSSTRSGRAMDGGVRRGDGREEWRRLLSQGWR
jgi:hypothetical protein